MNTLPARKYVVNRCRWVTVFEDIRDAATIVRRYREDGNNQDYEEFVLYHNRLFDMNEAERRALMCVLGDPASSGEVLV